MTKRVFAVALLATAVLLIGASVAVAATTSTYTAWSGAGNPHSAYTTTTAKCNVCHAVHKAPAGGQILLATSADNSCVYCHITSSVGVKLLYHQLQTNYDGSDSAYAHNAYVSGDAADRNAVGCVECHSVHGANTVAGASLEKILKTGAMAGIPATYTASTSSKEYQITGFCTKCHPYYAGGYETTVDFGLTSTNQLAAYTAAGITSFKSHVMTTSVTAYANTNGHTTLKVAWAGSDTCRSCHDGGNVDIVGVSDNSYPHFGTSPRFLLSGGYTGDTTGTANTATDDGVCLKCHRGNATTLGVGFTY
jgi:predicted CXXCH cytochrome family protein